PPFCGAPRGSGRRADRCAASSRVPTLFSGQSCSLHDLQQLFPHLIRRRLGVHVMHGPAALTEVVEHRPALSLVRLQTLADRFLAVIGTSVQRCAVQIAKTILLGRFQVYVVIRTAAGAYPATS